MIKYRKLNLGQIEVIVNRIGGMSSVQRLLAGELVVVEKSNLKPVPTEPREFSVWKTVTLGLKKSPKDYYEAMEKEGYSIGDYAFPILYKTKVSQTKVDLDLVVVTVGEFGFDRVNVDVFYAHVIELGLKLCPAEVGPALRRLCKDQSCYEWLYIGMKPITASSRTSYSAGFPLVFGIDNERELNCSCTDDRVLDADEQWVFVRPRK